MASLLKSPCSMGVLRSIAAAFAPEAAEPSTPPAKCPVCLEALTPHGSHVTLACSHQFCQACMESYANMKVRESQVDDGQLVCPVVDCKRSLSTEDLGHILDRDAFLQYERTLRRVRDEKNPLARWCPRPQCGELVVCEPGARTFSCPKCATVACVGCRGLAHWFAFLCRAKTWTSDASFSAWARSVGGARAVRACPQCQIQVWKNGGCNHMQCTRCSFEYCWECKERWLSCVCKASSGSGAWRWTSHQSLQAFVWYASCLLLVLLVVLSCPVALARKLGVGFTAAMLLCTVTVAALVPVTLYYIIHVPAAVVWNLLAN